MFTIEGGLWLLTPCQLFSDLLFLLIPLQTMGHIDLRPLQDWCLPLQRGLTRQQQPALSAPLALSTQARPGQPAREQPTTFARPS